jgi:mono/diheme cytochrome c family protein
LKQGRRKTNPPVELSSREVYASMPCDSPIASVATRSNQEGTMRSLIGAALAAGVAFGASTALGADAQAERGKYPVTIAGCNDCHTPGYFLGKPDFSRALSGSDVGFTIPGFGAFIGRNLTPDEDTGLGNWTDEQIITAFTKGVRPDGRQLAPIMPWQGARGALARRRRGDRRLSENPAAGEACRPRPIRPARRAVDPGVRHRPRRGLREDAEAVGTGVRRLRPP